MIAFDTDVLSQILVGDPRATERASSIPREDQCIPVVVAEEIVRGRLNVIRTAEAKKTKVSLAAAYSYFARSFQDLNLLRTLPYSDAADQLFAQWRDQGVRVSTHDLRIAAICVVNDARLISRNRKDFERIPRLNVEFWT